MFFPVSHLLAALVALCVSCATLVPVKEKQDAAEQLSTASAVDAHVYAPEEYARAQENFYQGEIEINKRKYKKARALLEKSKEEAQIAIAKSQAAQSIKAARDQLYQSDLAQLKKYITDVCDIAEASLDKAESAFEDEEYNVARQKAELSLQLSNELPKLMEEKIIEEKENSLSDIEWEKLNTQAKEIIRNARKEADAITEKAKRGAADIKARALERWFPSVYTVKKGDELHTIAGRKEIYNDSYQWPLIYKANRDQIRDPRMIFAGQNLVIPRDITVEELRDARKQAGAPAPYDPPPEAYHPSDYRAYRSVR
jgi:nucleoid-associated protein YgaU